MDHSLTEVQAELAAENFGPPEMNVLTSVLEMLVLFRSPVSADAALSVVIDVLRWGCAQAFPLWRYSDEESFVEGVHPILEDVPLTDLPETEESADEWDGSERDYSLDADPSLERRAGIAGKWVDVSRFGVWLGAFQVNLALSDLYVLPVLVGGLNPQLQRRWLNLLAEEMRRIDLSGTHLCMFMESVHAVVREAHDARGIVRLERLIARCCLQESAEDRLRRATDYASILRLLRAGAVKRPELLIHALRVAGPEILYEARTPLPLTELLEFPTLGEGLVSHYVDEYVSGGELATGPQAAIVSAIYAEIVGVLGLEDVGLGNLRVEEQRELAAAAIVLLVARESQSARQRTAIRKDAPRLFGLAIAVGLRWRGVPSVGELEELPLSYPAACSLQDWLSELA